MMVHAFNPITHGEARKIMNSRTASDIEQGWEQTGWYNTLSQKPNNQTTNNVVVNVSCLYNHVYQYPYVKCICNNWLIIETAGHQDKV